MALPPNSVPTLTHRCAKAVDVVPTHVKQMIIKDLSIRIALPPFRQRLSEWPVRHNGRLALQAQERSQKGKREAVTETSTMGTGFFVSRSHLSLDLLRQIDGRA